MKEPRLNGVVILSVSALLFILLSIFLVGYMPLIVKNRNLNSKLRRLRLEVKRREVVADFEKSLDKQLAMIGMKGLKRSGCSGCFEIDDICCYPQELRSMVAGCGLECVQLTPTVFVVDGRRYLLVDLELAGDFVNYGNFLLRVVDEVGFVHMEFVHIFTRDSKQWLHCEFWLRLGEMR